MLLVNVPLAVVTVNRIVLPYGIFTHAADTPPNPLHRQHPPHHHPTPSNSHKPRAPQSISMLFKQGSGNPSVVANKQKWQRQRPVSDGQTAALGYLSLLRPVCVCVFLGTSRNWATPIVSCELQSGGVAGNGQRPWRCAASGGSALWRWPGRLFPWPVRLSCGWGPLLSLLTLAVCVSTAPSPSFSLCFSIDSDTEGQRLQRGWTMREAVYLGNGDLFVCTWAEYSSPFFFFQFSSHDASPPPTLRLLLIPQ